MYFIFKNTTQMQSQPHISEIIAINALAQFGDRNEMDWR